ncbi:uncharacterized protein LOC100198323 isoform X2 [Hydra vulgaris]|uniref:Peroxisomal ATPase PEX1 n=3 Tax=Hydra vulgaris TaxID=6087 RepID=A0ABM4BGW4_HYDVU
MKIFSRIKVVQCKNNFVNLSKTLIGLLQCERSIECSQVDMPLLIQDEKKEFISTWSGKYFEDDGDPIIEIDGYLLALLGWNENDKITVSLYGRKVFPASRISVCPLKKNDWEIMELNHAYIETELLNQISLVKSGMVFLVYLSTQNYFPVKVEVTDPLDCTVYLQENTEVHLLFHDFNNPPVSTKHVCKADLTERKPTNLSDKLFINYLINLFGLEKYYKLKKSDLTCSKSLKPLSYCNHVSAEVCLQAIVSLPLLIDCNYARTNESCLEKSQFPLYTVLASESICFFKSSCIVKDVNYLIQLSLKEPNSSKEQIKIVLKVKFLPEQIWNTLFQNTNKVVLFVHPILLQQLQIESGSFVQINCYHDNIMHPKGFVLHTTPLASDIKEKLKDCFLTYLTESAAFESIVMNQGTLLIFNIGECIQVVVEIIGILNNVFCLIHCNSFSTMFIAVDDNEKDFSSHVYDERLLSNDEVSNGIIKELRACFNISDNECSKKDNSLCSTNQVVLLYGNGESTSTGCGKSYLLNLIASSFLKIPFCYRTVFVDNISLRGKKVDSIRDFWEKAYIRAVQSQPALLVFDDLNEIIPTVDLVEEGIAADLRIQRLAEIFQVIIERIAFEQKKIFVIATCSSVNDLHRSLLPETNNHLFSKYINIQEQNSSEYSCFKSVLQNIAKTMNCEIHLDFSDSYILNLKQKLNGSNPKDYSILCKRIIYNKLLEIKSDKRKFVLKSEDVEVCLENFKSCSLHTVELHKPKKVCWTDIGGLDFVKKTLKETLVWPALYPDLFKSCPVKLTSGLLLYGPPGTAKTMLASAVAFESQLNFISVKGPELLSKYVGSSENNVRDVFARARRACPCIIFFDEIDSLAPRRGHDNTGVTDRVVNQLLTQLDGIESLKGVYVLAATSRPDLIDPALLRPGRFDKSLHCTLPNLNEREDIFRIHLHHMKLHGDVDISKLAQLTENFSGADLKALLYNAQVRSIHRYNFYENDATVVEDDIIEALKSMKPSVNSEERQKFHNIFTEYQSSRCDYRSKIEQKVTLA